MVKAEKTVQGPDQKKVRELPVQNLGLGEDLVCLEKAGVHGSMVNEGYVK